MWWYTASLQLTINSCDSCRAYRHPYNITTDVPAQGWYRSLT
jgi:hypothetical protein